MPSGPTRTEPSSHGPKPQNLDIGRDADAEERAALLPLLPLPGAQLGVAHALEGVVERAGVLAAVVREPGRGPVGKARRRDEIPPSKLSGIDRELAGEEIHAPLDQVGRLGPARPAIRLAEALVGEDPPRLRPHVRDVVDTRDHDSGERRNDGRHPAVVSAAVHHELEVDAEKLALGIGGETQHRPLVAAVAGDEIVLGARCRPAHRALQAPGEHHRDDVLAVDVHLGAEAAPHLGRDDAELVTLEPEHLDESVSERVGDLGRGPERAALVPVEGAGGGPGLHGVGHEPLDRRAELDDGRRGGKGAIDVASGNAPEKRAVCRGLRVKDRRPLGESGVRVDDRFERLVVHFDGEDGVGGDIRVLGDDDGDGLADVAHSVEGEDRPLGLVQLRERSRVGLGGDAEGSAELGAEVGGGEDAQHAWNSEGGLRSHREHLRVGVGAADEGEGGGAFERHVRGVQAAAGDEGGVFATTNASANELRDLTAHGSPWGSSGEDQMERAALYNDVVPLENR